MDKSPIVKAVHLKKNGVLVEFTGRTGIMFQAANNGSVGLDSIVVSHQGKQVAYCHVRRWKPGSAVVFDELTAPATAELVGIHCLAAYDKIHEDIDNVKSSPMPSPEDHLRILDIVSPGEECYQAMMA